MEKYKKLYDVLVENGELKRWFPFLTGDWEKDAKRFTKEQEKLEQISGVEVDEK